MGFTSQKLAIKLLTALWRRIGGQMTVSSGLVYLTESLPDRVLTSRNATG